MKPIDTVVLASGRGSNFQAIVNAVKDGSLSGINLRALVVDRAETGAEKIAREAGIEVHLVQFSAFVDRAAFDDAVLSVLSELNPDLVMTLGWMRILTAELVENFDGRIINIHPSLLPAFKGMHAQRQASEYGVRVSGATVNFDDSGVDTGPIILREAVTLEPGMSPEAVADAILVAEHRIIVEAARLFASGKIKLSDRQVMIDP